MIQPALPVNCPLSFGPVIFQGGQNVRLADNLTLVANICTPLTPEHPRTRDCSVA
jgi:hypothetical protein